MNEEPKSIWKKSFTGRTALVIWLALAAFTIMLGSFMGALANHSGSMSGWLLLAGIITGICLAACLLIIYVVWPSLRWLFWKHWRWALFGCACFVTLIALFYVEEDWRGWHAWNKFKHTWEAKGERFDRASVIPPMVPDDQNFALTPIVASSYSSMLDKNGHEIRPQLTNVVDRLKMSVSHNDDTVKDGIGNWQKSTMSNLKLWQQYYRAQAAKTNEFPVAVEPQSPAVDVLLALSKYDSAIEEVRQASKLPYSRFPMEYDKENTAAILLPDLSALRKCGQVLQLRAIAELQNGKSDEALADVKLMLRLADSIHSEPILISHLVRNAIVNLVLQPVWEGLAEHKWSDAQLVETEQELAKLDFLSDCKLSMRGELVLFQGGMFDFLRHHPETLPGLSGGNEGNFKTPLPARILCRLIPSGWIYQNQLRCARMMVEVYLPLADANQGVVAPTAIRRADAAIENDTRHLSPYNIAERLFLPALGRAVERFAHGQNAVNMARVACALERYQLAHSEYPKSLDLLTPQFIAKLPHDIINGQPLNYRRTTDQSSQGSAAASGQFVLYSVGWNEKDDDGEVGLTENGTVDREVGDWVWRYPAK